MPYSQFTTARLKESGSVLVATGPFGFADEEPPATVTSLHFVVIQGNVVVSGDGEAAAGVWDGTAEPAEKLSVGPAEGLGVAVLVIHGPPPTVRTFTWIDRISITA